MIICAAIKDTSTGQVFYGPRHEDIYEMMCCFGYKRPSDFFIEGFVDEANNFYDRRETYAYALRHHQLPTTVVEWKEEKFERELYSEDLY